MDASALYDSYEVEYLPNEGLVSTSRHLFIELTTDATGTSTGVALRYQGEKPTPCFILLILDRTCGCQKAGSTGRYLLSQVCTLALVI